MDSTEELDAPRAPVRLDEVEKRLSAIEGAFRRIGEGTYGSCESCGDRLGEDLLAADPTARWCPRCSETAPS